MTATPSRRDRTARSAGSDALPPPSLGVAIEMALSAMSDLRALDRDTDQRLELLLRASLARHRAAGHPDGGAPDPGVAVQTACAHLAVSDREDAYLALRAAQDSLRGTTSADP